MNCIVLGATKGMGRAVSRALVARGDRLCLLGRNQEDLNRTAQDLHVRGELTTAPETLLCDLGDPDTFSTVLDAAVTALGGVDLMVVTAAVFATQDGLDQDPGLARRLMQTNFVNTIEFCEHASQRLLSNGGGTLCVFSSVAGDRGRASLGSMVQRRRAIDLSRGARPPVSPTGTEGFVCEAWIYPH